ncbi:MAG: hypothetical protein WCB11_24860 [Terriglobales bacterium]
MFRSAKKLADAEVKPELAHTNDRLKAGLMIVRVGLAENPKARAGDLKSSEQGDVKCVEFHFALKSRRQSFDDRGAQDRLSVRYRDSYHGENYDG